MISFNIRLVNVASQVIGCKAVWVVSLFLLAALPGSTIRAASLGSGAVGSHTVRLYRDQFGMAHLYAAREEDGFFGLGYAVGEDRLREVLTWYVAVRGELSVRFGTATPLPYPSAPGSGVNALSNSLADALAIDRRALRYRLLAAARSNFGALPLQYQKDLRAYINGLRAYMRTHPDRTPSWAPPLEPALPLALFDLIVSEAHGVCDARRLVETSAQVSHSAAIERSATGPVAFGGSNAWAVAGSRTVDGGTFLESDSHSPIESYGTLFYPYRVKAGTFDFMAFDPVGTVMFFFGHSPYFAWGHTEGRRFVADCYRIATDPNSPQSYRVDGTPRKLVAFPYRIAVKSGAVERGLFEYARINGMLAPVESREGDTAFAVSYASAERTGFAAAQYYEMAKARTRVQLEAALAHRDAYPANMVIAGADGTIMYIRGGRIPIRGAGVDVERPLDGNTSASDWRGIHSYADSLKLINPPQGYVANSNISPDMMYADSPLRPTDYPRYFGFEPGLTNSRQQRLLELLDRPAPLGVETAKAIAMDETIPSTRAWGPAIGRMVAENPEWVARAPAALAEFLHDLAQFDGTFSKESRGALAHFELRRVLFERHHSEEQSLRGSIEAGSPLSSPQQQLLVAAAAEAMAQLRERYGRTDLNWGDVHRVGRGGVDLPIGGARLTAGTVAGTASMDRTLRALAFTFDAGSRRERLTGGQRIPFLVHFSTAGVQSFAQTLWGVSDDPDSSHFSDQARLASEKILRPIPLSEEALRQEHAAVVSLLIDR